MPATHPVPVSTNGVLTPSLVWSGLIPVTVIEPEVASVDGQVFGPEAVVSGPAVM